jgi:hypothetical protein
VPDKLDRCVADVKAKGGVENPWAVCKASIGKETKEKVNQNRIDPYPSPDIKKGKIEPVIDKTPKGVGGKKIVSPQRKKQESILLKQILDTKLR